jgi:hypothetical protein
VGACEGVLQLCLCPAAQLRAHCKPDTQRLGSILMCCTLTAFFSHARSSTVWTSGQSECTPPCAPAPARARQKSPVVDAPAQLFSTQVDLLVELAPGRVLTGASYRRME